MIQEMKQAGFKFNKTTTENGNPEQRHILFFYKDDLDQNTGKRSLNSQNSHQTLSTRITSNTGSVSKLSQLSSPHSKGNEKFISSVKSTSSKYQHSEIPRIAFHKFPMIQEGPVSQYKITSENGDQPSCNFYYRSSRYK